MCIKNVSFLRKQIRAPEIEMSAGTYVRNDILYSKIWLLVTTYVQYIVQIYIKYDLDEYN